MVEEKLLTVREVALFLGMTEKEVIDYAESGLIPAYKVGGVYLRFKRNEIEEFKRRNNVHLKKIDSAEVETFSEKLKDFFYFNDFYIISFILIGLILLIIFLD